MSRIAPKALSDKEVCLTRARDLAERARRRAKPVFYLIHDERNQIPDHFCTEFFEKAPELLLRLCNEIEGIRRANPKKKPNPITTLKKQNKALRAELNAAMAELRERAAQ